MISTGVRFDITLPVISAVAPDTNAYVNDTDVSYTLSEALSSGSVTWTWTGGILDGTPVHTRSLPGDELASGPHSGITVASPPPLVNGAVYAIGFDGIDLAGNSADTAISTGVTFDLTLPVISAVAPASNAYVNDTIVSYTLSEPLSSGTITWTRTGGLPDGTTHEQQLTASERTVGIHNNITLANPPTLVDGAIYSISFDGIDRAGNSAATVVCTGVTFDTSAPTLTSVSIASDNDDTSLAIVGNVVTLTFSASEALVVNPSVTIDTKTADSVNDLGSNDYTATRVMQTGDSEAVVAFTIDFTDAAGNPGAQVISVTDGPSVTFDETKPAMLSISPANLTDTDVGTVNVVIVFSETMKASVNPSPTITGLISPYTITGSAWSDTTLADDTWTGSFTLFDSEEENNGFYNVTGFADAAGNVMEADTNDTVIVDTSSPAILSVTTSDADSNGKIDKLTIVFSRSVDIADGDTNDGFPQIVFGSYTIDDDDYGILNTTTLELTLTESTEPDTDTWDITFTNDGDLTENGSTALVLDYGPTPATDGALPVFVSAETADVDGNGYLDAIKLTLSEPIDDSTVLASHFDVAGTTNEYFAFNTNDDVADNNVIYISFYGGTDKTDQTPGIDYTAGTLADFAGNLCANTSFASSTDRAGPAILNVVVEDINDTNDPDKHRDYVYITFSEDTDEIPMTEGATVGSRPDDILELYAPNGDRHSWLDDNDSWQSLSWVSADVLMIQIDANNGGLALPSIEIGDSIKLVTSPTGVNIKDALAVEEDRNVATEIPFSAITGSFTNATAGPTIYSIRTGDENFDGFIDFLVVRFDKQIDSSTISAGDFTLSGDTIIPGNHTVTMDDYVADDSEIILRLTDGLDDTGEIPELSASAGAFKDTAGTDSQAFGPIPATDGAPPVFLSASATDNGSSGDIFDATDDALTLTFSEALADTYSGGTGDLTMSIMEDNLDFGSTYEGSNNLPDTGTITFIGKTVVITATESTATTLMPVGTVAQVRIAESTHLADSAGNEIINTAVFEGFAFGTPGAYASASRPSPRSTTSEQMARLPQFSWNTPSGNMGYTTPDITTSIPGYTRPTAPRSSYRTVRSVLDLLKPTEDAALGSVTETPLAPRGRISADTEAYTVDTAAGETAVVPERNGPARELKEVEVPLPEDMPPAASRTEGAAAQPAAGGEPETTLFRLGKQDLWVLAIIFLLGIGFPFVYHGIRRRKE